MSRRHATTTPRGGERASLPSNPTLTTRHPRLASNPRIFSFWWSDFPPEIRDILTRGGIVESDGTGYERVIAQGVQRAIQEAGYRSADEFALAIGLPRSTLSRVLNGKADTRISTLNRIAQALSKPLDEFLAAPSPSRDSLKTHRLRSPGRPQREDIRIQISIPAGVEIPQWLQDVLERDATLGTKTDSVLAGKAKSKKERLLDLRLPSESSASTSVPDALRSTRKKSLKASL